MHGHTDYGGYTEGDYIIERKGETITMQESWFSHEDFDDDDERADAYEEWENSPEYGEKVFLKGGQPKANEPQSINDVIVEYLKAHNLPHDAEAVAKLSVTDVYAIMAGTYGKE